MLVQRSGVFPIARAAGLALEPDGVFLSNGPGDPEPCDYAVEAIRALVVADLDLDKIREVRNTWQFFRDRRPDTYGALVAD